MESAIIEKEIYFRTSRSSGSGGQHVNKTETRVELCFEVQASQGLSNAEKAKVEQSLSKRINKAGVLSLSCERHRSQLLNRSEVTTAFFELLRKALRPAKRRRGPSPMRANAAKRLQAKQRRSDKKALRGRVQISAQSVD